MPEPAQTTIPTYDPDREEHDESKQHVLSLLAGGGLRVVMGEYQDADAPDVLIERATDRWCIIVHPDAGDPLCIIEFTDTACVIMTDGPDGKTLLTQPRAARSVRKGASNE